MLEGASALVEPLSRMKWKVAAFDEPVLITSDRPVSLWVKDPGPFFVVGVLTVDEDHLVEWLRGRPPKARGIDTRTIGQFLAGAHAFDQSTARP